MASISAQASVFDPAYPFASIPARTPGFDTWFGETIITRELRQQLPLVPDEGTSTLVISSGMQVRVPTVRIGVQLGSIRIGSIVAAVVDDGEFDLLIGADVLKGIFSNDVAESGESQVTVTSEARDDPEALAIELYPVTGPVNLVQVEKTFRSQRRLHNIFLVATKQVALPDVSSIDRMLEDDALIPDSLQLKLTWIATGSIWTTLKSGSQNALRYVATLFQQGTAAKIAHQLAESRKAEEEAQLQIRTRDATIERIQAEMARISVENRAAAQAAWRDEVRGNLGFMDELIEQLDDVEMIAYLKRRKQEAILELAEQQLLPVVRNIPRTKDLPTSPFFLPLPPGSPEAVPLFSNDPESRGDDEMGDSFRLSR